MIWTPVGAVRSTQALLWALAALIVLIVAVSWLSLALRARLEAWRLRRRRRRGALGQRRARTVLERHGFDVLAEEHPAAGALEVDGRTIPYTVRVDYLVRRAGRTFGVEVKTGERAPDPTCRATRRQLLEYSQLLDVDGLLLLDMEARRLMEVRFCGASRRRGLHPLLLLGLGLALGLVVATLLQR
jgi:hypothetical protein